MEATAPVDTVILEIAATDPNPTRAAQIANAVGQELQERGQLSCRLREEMALEAVQVTTIAAAEVPDEASSPKILSESRRRPDRWVCCWD